MECQYSYNGVVMKGIILMNLGWSYKSCCGEGNEKLRAEGVKYKNMTLTSNYLV